MGELVSINGEHVAPSDAKVSVFDRGFLFGDSVFETVRTYGGEPFLLTPHLERLRRSAERVAFELPVSVPALAMEVRRAARAARNDESYIRVMVTRGSGPLGLDPALARDPLRVILVAPYRPLPTAAYRDGVSVVTARVARAGDAAPGAKVGNYLASLLALRDAHAVGAHEAFIVDDAGHVVEGTTSNVFAVLDGAIVTPPEEAGILLGITRGRLIQLARESGREVHERALEARELGAADEVFLCSTLREIVPVVRVDGAVVASGTPGPVTRDLHARFRAMVGLASARLPWEAP